MASIKIKDLPKDQKISIEEMRKVVGGLTLKELEARMKALGDDSQLAYIDLQNVNQSYHQTLQMYSGISKILHDTSISVIRKMG